MVAARSRNPSGSGAPMPSVWWRVVNNNQGRTLGWQATAAGGAVHRQPFVFARRLQQSAVGRSRENPVAEALQCEIRLGSAKARHLPIQHRGQPRAVEKVVLQCRTGSHDQRPFSPSCWATHCVVCCTPGHRPAMSGGNLRRSAGWSRARADATGCP
jgi:hypothetical protein